MYIIKQIPEDFIVKEIPDIKISKEGNYAYFKLKKRSYTTEKAVSAVAKALNAERKHIGYSGSKDKNAVTEQVISVYRPKNKEIKLNDIETEYLGRGNEPVSLGGHKGNEFIITVRGLEKQIKIKNKKIQFPNYFDEQRFSRNNLIVGRHLLKKDFREAVKAILDYSTKKGISEKKIEDHIKKKPNDHIGAISILPRKTRMMYIHAFQSFVFNEALSRTIEKNTTQYKKVKYSLGSFLFPCNEMQNKTLSLPGFGSEISPGSIASEILKEQKISLRDFIIKQIPGLSSEGDKREMFSYADDINAEYHNDELNKGRNKCIISFTLQKGSYATILIKKIFE